MATLFSTMLNSPSETPSTNAVVRKNWMMTAIAEALYLDTSATLDDLREAVTTLEETERIARRVLGGAHPLTNSIEIHLWGARTALRARETPPTSG